MPGLKTKVRRLKGTIYKQDCVDYGFDGEKTDDRFERMQKRLQLKKEIFPLMRV